jgi:serpin B
MVGRLEISVACLAVLLITACGSPPAENIRPVSMNLTDSSTGFGLALANRLLAEPGAGNVFISPLSLTLALSMAASAAEGATRASILTTLGLDPTVDPGSQANLTIDRLMKSDANAQLELAQSAWFDKHLTLNGAYVARLRADYHAKIANLDFGSQQAPRMVNDWVANATHNKITQLIDGFDPTVVAYLVNATYFHASWATEFKPVQAPGEFRTFSGGSASVPMMQRKEVISAWASDYTAVLLPYKGGRFSMVLLLPRTILSPSEFAHFLTQATWKQLLTSLHTGVGPQLGGTTCVPNATPEVTVNCDSPLVMPKFKLDYKAQLLPSLTAMGMAISPLSNICLDCYISGVIHKTHLEVDEKGTSAQAATGVEVRNLSLQARIVVDRPFALALIDNASDAPLFLGVIGNL